MKSKKDILTSFRKDILDLLNFAFKPETEDFARPVVPNLFSPRSTSKIWVVREARPSISRTTWANLSDQTLAITVLSRPKNIDKPQ